MQLRFLGHLKTDVPMDNCVCREPTVADASIQNESITKSIRHSSIKWTIFHLGNLEVVVSVKGLIESQLDNCV